MLMHQGSCGFENIAAVCLSMLPLMRYLVLKKWRGTQCQDGMGVMLVGLL